MKNQLFVLLAALSILIACGEADKTSEQFIIDGKLTGLEDQSKIFLRYNIGDSLIIDTAVLEGGTYSFQGRVAEPTLAGIFLEDYRGAFQLYLENESIAITSSMDDLDKSIIQGSREQDKYDLLKVNQAPYSDQVNELVKGYFAAREEGDRALMDELESQIDSLDALQNEVIAEFILENPGSYVSINQLENLAYSSEYKELNELYSSLDEEIRNSSAGKNFKQYLEKRLKTDIGQVAPDFSQADSTGKEVKLSDLRGSYVLLDFWAAWCGPCRAENPNIVNNYHKYKDKGFTVLGVSLDDDKDKWLAAVAKDGLDWVQLSDLKGWNNDASSEYGIRAIPANFLLDPNGVILAQNVRGPELGNKLAEIFD